MDRPSKPRDVGNGVVCASFGRGGEWLSLATVDPDAGFVELTGLPPFDPAWRGDPGAVRRYRSWMCLEEHAFLRVEADGGVVVTHEEAPGGTRRMVQHVVVRGDPARHPARVGIVFRGRLALPALAEITETDPPDAAGTTTRLEATTDRLRIRGAGPPVEAEVLVRHGPPRHVAWHVSPEGLPGTSPTAEAWLDWPADAHELRLDVGCSFLLPVPGRPGWLRPDDPARVAGATRAAARARPIRPARRHAAHVRRIARRAITYARECTALLVAPGERCVLTDHRILPLSWTRDAWWQARLLLDRWSTGGPADDERAVADHLRWLFLRCERPDGRWVRSHHADGRRKDTPFQADQQLYPLLELAEHVAATGNPPELPPSWSWADLVAGAWAGVDAAIDPDSGLIASDENPADDVAILPFLVSHQVLLWHAAVRLADVAGRLGVAAEPFATVARRTRTAVDEHFVVEGPLGRQWAYAVDGRGSAERFMDANDLPVALAPLWGFCEADDPVWRNTVRFAFDAANPGFSRGPAGGLGSRHTPGTWTLGDVMGLVAFSLMDDRPAAAAALDRLVAVAFEDGMLPEAYDPAGSGQVVRHWFAWPGAALAACMGAYARRPPRPGRPRRARRGATRPPRR